MQSISKILPSWLKEENIKRIPGVGEIVTGKVFYRTKNELWVKIDERTIGVVPPREIKDGLGTAKSLKVGDEVTASVVSPENKDGYMVLSLKRAARDTVWKILEKKKETGEVFEIYPSKANRGGLIATVHNIQGFIPVSQLSLENYPRVKDGNKEEILAKIKRLLGKPMKVRVLDVNRKEKKLIFSEKATYSEEVEEFIKKLEIGEVVNGTVSGIVDFGVFVTLEKGIEGLIHISEIAWEHVSDPFQYFKEGQKIKAKVIDITDGKISLSTRQMTEDPWKKAVEGIKLGSMVKGKVLRIVPYGAIVKIGDYVNAILHISELSETPVEKASQVVEVNKEYTFRVVEFDPEEHRMGLSLKGVENSLKQKTVEGEDVTSTEQSSVAEILEDKVTKPESTSRESIDNKEDKMDSRIEVNDSEKEKGERETLAEFFLSLGLTKRQAEILASSGISRNELMEEKEGIIKERLLSIKGIGEKAVEKILSTRKIKS